MTFLAPGFLVLGLAAAGVMVLLHLIARDRPPRESFPTARFVPARVERAITRAVRPADPLLLAMRALVLVLAGAAFARPVVEPSRSAVARIVALDLSRATASPAAARDSALALLGERDALVVFDSAARVVGGSIRDTLAALPVGAAGDAPGTRPRGSLSAALIAAQRAAVPLRDRADSLELVLVSPLAVEELDAATMEIRSLWPGRIRLVAVAAVMPADSTRDPLPEVRGDADDPVAIAVALLGGAHGDAGGGARSRADDAPAPPRARPNGRDARHRARIVRATATGDDSAEARAGAPLVIWPADAAALGWPARPAADTVGAVVAGGAVLVAPFPRPLRTPPGSPGATVVARWVDGEPAAIEMPIGRGCVREVAIPIDPVGDLALREDLRHLVVALSSPCGGRVQRTLLDGAARARLSGEGPLVAARRVPPERASITPLVPWLLAAALLLALLEPLARRLRRRE